MSQSVVENGPKSNVQNVLRPKVKLVPKAKVQGIHTSGKNSTVNSAGKESTHNQSANMQINMPKKSNNPKMV